MKHLTFFHKHKRHRQDYQFSIFSRTFALIVFSAMTLLLGCNSPKTGHDGQGEDGDSLNTQERTADTLTLCFTGDIMLGNIYPRPRVPEDSARHLFDHVRTLLSEADFSAGNLEGTFAYTGRPRKNPQSKLAFMFMMPPHFAQRLTEAGYDFVGLANNHIYDFWDEAMVSTERTLDGVGLAYAGAKDPQGKTQQREYAIVERNGVRYGCAAFGHEDYSLRTQDTATVARILKTLREKSDIVVVCFHGGAEGSACRHLPHGTEYFHGDDRGNLRSFAHFCIDHGADVVYGHGPHVVRAVELYKDRFIAYSLGNFSTAGMGVASLTGYAPVLQLKIASDGHFLSGHIHSFLQQPMRGPQPDSKFLAAKEIKQLTEEDCPNTPLIVGEDGTLTKK